MPTSGSTFVAYDPPVGWSPKSPPPPPPPLYTSPNRRGHSVLQSRSAKRRGSTPHIPGLVVDSSDNSRLRTPYFQNAALIKIKEKHFTKKLREKYKSPEPRKRPLRPQTTFELDDVHVKTLQTIFTLLDSNQDKLLDTDQLQTAIIAMGIPPKQRLIKEIFKHVPAWAGKGVDFNTFKTVITDNLKSNPVHMADIDELFKIFEETDGKGVITDSHLRHVMTSVFTTNKTNLSNDEVNEIFKELGITRNKSLYYRKFLADISSGFVNFA